MRKVLVVEDSTMMHALYRQFFARTPDVVVAFAKNGKEELDAIERDAPHVVFLDVNMPVMGGLELLEELKTRGLTARVPVVLVTTEGSPEDVRRGLEAGAVAYLRKPFQRADLLKIFERVLPQKP